MNLLDLLFENEDQEQNDSIDLRRIKNLALVTKETPIEQVEDALDNLNNYKDAGYGQYVTYQRNADPSINPAIQKAFGPGGGPNMKTPANRKEWNSADREWRIKKAKDIQTRTELDATGWEDLTFDQLPKEATDWKVFYPLSSLDAMVPIILDITQKSDILNWVEEDGFLVFPRKENKIIPGDGTLEKVLRTVMKNAGISDFSIIPKEDKGETSDKPKEKPVIADIPPYRITNTPEGDSLSIGYAEDLKDELESKISELNPGASDLKVKVVISKQNPENAILQIGGFKSNKERGAIQQKIQGVINNLNERKLRRAFQVRAGIIK